MKINHIYQGDCLEIMKEFPDESIQCCITSPPYYGLRDYQTATWDGGDAGCDHIQTENKHGGERSDRNQEGYKKFYQNICKKCGATRIDNQIGLEKTPEEYVEKLVKIFREVRRVLRKDGTLWLNLGNSYASSPKGNKKPSGLQSKNYGIGKDVPMKRNIDWKKSNLKQKDLIGIPWMVAFALRTDGYYLRQDIIWKKGNPMPESATDRCTKSHEYLFLLSKSQKYYFDNEAIKEKSVDPESYIGRKFRGPKEIYKQNAIPGKMNHQSFDKGNNELINKKYPMRNKRSVWTVNTKPFKKAHFATFPPALIEPCVLAGSAEDDIILDPFIGSGTTGYVAKENNRQYIGIELNPEYIEIANQRIKNAQPQLF